MWILVNVTFSWLIYYRNQVWLLLHSLSAKSTLLRSGGNYHHSVFHNPTAAVNLFHVGKQYLTFCKAEAAVTHNLIGRKLIGLVKHSDARNSLPILDVIRSSHKRHSAPARVLQMNATSNDRCLLYAYICYAQSVKLSSSWTGQHCCPVHEMGNSKRLWVPSSWTEQFCAGVLKSPAWLPISWTGQDNIYLALSLLLTRSLDYHF